jgi:hypothetical protein
MPAQSFFRIGRTSLAIAAVGALGVGIAVAPAATRYGTAPAAITKSGVDGVKIGSTYTKLRDKNLIGKIRPGCELGGPNTRSAPLKAPLKGQVNFTLTAPRRVTDITITGGATAKGVGIGATIPDIQAAYPKAKVDHSTDETFLLTFVRIPKSGGGKFEFGVDTTTKKVTVIGIPFIAVCE